MSSFLLRILFALAALTTVATAAERPGAVHGLVVLNPACPGPLRQDADCAARPLQTTVDVFTTADRTRASAVVASDGAGRFTIELAPGRYVFVPRPPRPGAAGKPAEIDVRAAAIAEVTLTVDSGLR